MVKHAGGAADRGARALPCRRGGGADRRSRQRAAATARLGGSGHGLVGMRERVRVYGGELHAGRGAAAASRCACGCRSRARTSGADGAERGRDDVRVLIADDQALVRAGFKMILDAEDDLDVVGEAGRRRRGGRAARAAQARRRADGHPHAGARRDRGDAPRRRARRRPPVRVLMLTTFDLNEYVYEALRAGASGFLLKDVPPEQLAGRHPRRRAGRGAARAVDHQAADPGVRRRAGRDARRRRGSTS